MSTDIYTIDVFKNLSLTFSEREIIRSCFTEKSIKKGEHLLLNGEDVNSILFVLDGCLRTYFIDDKGKEHTLQFAVYDWWISDMMAYFSETKALLNIECIMDATVFEIQKNSLEKLCIKIPVFNRLYRDKVEGSIVGYQKRIISILSQTATERYLGFIEKYPDIEMSIKNYHLASYLGITTESLSRIRKELSSPK
ncbi:Crp/Fnr family transcriptional regulator [Flammeovirga aprica]|uniref:Crp/Fnr family transcriptional regulator n=1 Tax=Flammeovirga aprica JL-4 TaxID=694437 RepID=A0A7X9RSQ2_9BACT|nr:Crp/Fnr family transcriptional regulator [Flammeovirga aprica]NME67381.1 Crp/Fnr family transcriptional regulator [Flammeovirga aprica JL-4]